MKYHESGSSDSEPSPKYGLPYRTGGEDDAGSVGSGSVGSGSSGIIFSDGIVFSVGIVFSIGIIFSVDNGCVGTGAGEGEVVADAAGVADVADISGASGASGASLAADAPLVVDAPFEPDALFESDSSIVSDVLFSSASSIIFETSAGDSVANRFSGSGPIGCRQPESANETNAQKIINETVIEAALIIKRTVIVPFAPPYEEWQQTFYRIIIHFAAARVNGDRPSSPWRVTRRAKCRHYTRANFGRVRARDSMR